MKYQHRENGKIMEILKQDDKKGTMLIQFEDGKSTSITSGTFKRWYKKVKEESKEETSFVDTLAATVGTAEEKEIPLHEEIFGTPEEATPEAPAEEPTKPDKKAPKVKKEKTPRTVNPEVNKIVDYVFKKVLSMGKGVDVFTPDKAPKVRAFKVDGHMFARMNIATSHVSICCRSKVVTVIPTKFTHHMFDAIYEIKDLSNPGLIDTVLKESFEYQKNKNTHKKEEK